MKRNTRNAAKTKQEIIEKAAPIFNIHGYSGTKMQMLVDATGYQMGGIYRHFETKMALGKAAFQYNYDVLVKPNFDIDTSLNPKAQLIAIFENYKKMILKPKIAGGCPLLNTGTEVDDTNEEFRQLARSYIEEVLVVIEDILEKGKVSGCFKPAIKPKQEAQYLFASVQGAILLVTTLKNIEPIFNIFDRIYSYLEDRVFQDDDMT